jgi:hypothetical protein
MRQKKIFESPQQVTERPLMEQIEQLLKGRYPGISGIAREWGKLADVKSITSLGRARIYEILTEEPGAFQSFVLKRPGAKSGARLFNLASVRNYMEKRCAESAVARNNVRNRKDFVSDERIF